MANDREWKCFFIGLGIGTIAGFLFAPNSGADTRQLIQDKAAEGSGYLKDQAAGVVQTAADAMERGGKTIRHRKENVIAAVEAGKAAYNEATAATPAL